MRSAGVSVLLRRFGRLKGFCGQRQTISTRATETKKMEVELVPALSDNYVFVGREPGGAIVIVDPAEKLKSALDAKIVGHAADASRIPGIDISLNHGETYEVGDISFTLLQADGHTVGHCLWHAPKLKVCFVGDTIFALGCGRLFEGTPAQMYASLNCIANMPPETILYCAHEYTLNNSRFALYVDPKNSALLQRVERIKALRDSGIPTVPTTVAEEIATNPFLRGDDEDLRRAAGICASSSSVQAFATLRKMKDSF